LLGNCSTFSISKPQVGQPTKSSSITPWCELAPGQIAGSGETLCGAGAPAFTGRFHSDEKRIPPDVIAGRGRPPAREGLVQQFEADDLVGSHEEPVGKGTAAGAVGLIAKQLDRSFEDSVIVRLNNALLVVVYQPDHARLFDSRPDQWNRFEHRHT
jgi:hypothetical protein